MKETTFKNFFNTFVSNNSSLISRYENECNDIFEDNYDDIYRILNKVLTNKINIELKILLERAVNNAIVYQSNIQDSLIDICDMISAEILTDNALNIYFKEVNEVYNKHDNNYDIVYCPENRDKLIEMNLKTVISIAKKYQNLGLDLEDLIQAGNLGLCVSFDKYKPERSKLKDNMLAKAEELSDEVTVEELRSQFSAFLKYGDISKKFEKDFDKDIYSKDHVIKWIKRNISNAKFNSVATMWIKAFILQELNNNSRTVKKPKAEIDRDVIETGAYKKEIKIDIDAPIGDDDDGRTLGDNIRSEDTYHDMEIAEARDIFKNGLNLLLDGVKPRDRSVFLKKFGIGLPRPMLPREIAEQEGFSIARVSQIFQTIEQQIQKNQVKYNIDIEKLTEAAKLLR